MYVIYLPTKHQRALGTRSKVSVRSRSKVFEEGGKPENPEKNPRSRDENQQQTQPTYDAESGNRTRATFVGGEYSHHCAIPAPTVSQIFLINLTNRRIPANPNYHMSIKKTQAILKCFMHLKSSAWFMLGSENDTMFCDTWNLFIRSCLHFAACGHCCVVHRTEKYACFIRVGIIWLPPFRLNNCIVH